MTIILSVVTMVTICTSLKAMVAMVPVCVYTQAIVYLSYNVSCIQITV